ncbi:uncharacterized protein LOC141642743 [Silene latifolia]|uniref:uncharacterized protein LOC141642743 n=1 Tax=Silene latifolia TaxID=37657 RepID=UPI003D77A706
MIVCRMCVASNSLNKQLLRTQLDQLHSEAHSTRRKANNARFRLIRLSEAADNLCRQASKSLGKGQEDDAREILIQKNNIMRALEKSKDRVEILDQLAAKLNQAISIKEAQLVENVASDLEIDGNDAVGPVRIVSPIPGSMNNLPDKIDTTLTYSDVVNDQESNPESFDTANKATTASPFSGVSSYIDFLNDVDQQLDKIEKDLRAIGELSTMVLENEEKLKKSRAPQISVVLAHVHETRARVHNFIDQIEATN